MKVIVESPLCNNVKLEEVKYGDLFLFGNSIRMRLEFNAINDNLNYLVRDTCLTAHIHDGSVQFMDGKTKVISVVQAHPLVVTPMR